MIQRWWSTTSGRSRRTTRRGRTADDAVQREENAGDERGSGARHCRQVLAASIAAGMLVAACGGSDDADADADNDAESLYTLGIQTGDEMTFEDAQISFTSDESVRWFSDRPARLVGSVPLAEFEALWDDGGTFHDDPPNAALVVDAGDPIVVELVDVDVDVDADTVTYDTRTLLGEVPASSAKVTLVIDYYCMANPADC